MKPNVLICMKSFYKCVWHQLVGKMPTWTLDVNDMSNELIWTFVFVEPIIKLWILDDFVKHIDLFTPNKAWSFKRVKTHPQVEIDTNKLEKMTCNGDAMHRRIKMHPPVPQSSWRRKTPLLSFLHSKNYWLKRLYYPFKFFYIGPQ